MLRFEVYRDGAAAEHVDLSGAYVFGQDGIPVRADLAAAKGQVLCLKRTPGACGLAVLWDAGGPGRMMLPTSRLPDRKEPYILNVELARAAVMRVIQKREDEIPIEVFNRKATWRLSYLPRSEDQQKPQTVAVGRNGGGAAAALQDQPITEEGLQMGCQCCSFSAIHHLTSLFKKASYFSAARPSSSAVAVR